MTFAFILSFLVGVFGGIKYERFRAERRALQPDVGLYEIRFGKFSAYVGARNEYFAGQNMDGIVKAVVNDEDVRVTGSTLVSAGNPKR